MCFDYSLLNGRIVEKYQKRAKFAEALELSERSLSLKMNNKVPWSQRDIQKAITLLDISPKDIPAYFFVKKVQ